MNLLKKAAAVITAAAVMMASAVSAGAAKITDWWEEADLAVVDTYAEYVKAGGKYTDEFKGLYYGLHWKFEAAHPGIFTFDIECPSPTWTLSVCDSDGITVKASSLKVSVGKGDYDQYSNIRINRDSAEKTAKVKVSYQLEAETYYILFTNYNKDGGKLTFKTTFERPSLDDIFTISLKKGKSIQLDMGSGLSWSSSKPSVASVSQTGKITAKKAGKAVISVTNGSKTLKINVKVTK